MSSDNGIYLVQFKDGWRVAHLQAIDNIYWHSTCCNNPDIDDYYIPFDNDQDYHQRCKNCSTLDPEWEKREEINPVTIYNYFKDSLVYNSEEDAMKKADEIYAGIINDDFSGLVEYGICIINGLENREFPKGE